MVGHFGREDSSWCKFGSKESGCESFGKHGWWWSAALYWRVWAMMCPKPAAGHHYNLVLQSCWRLWGVRGRDVLYNLFIINCDEVMISTFLQLKLAEPTACSHEDVEMLLLCKCLISGADMRSSRNEFSCLLLLSIRHDSEQDDRGSTPNSIPFQGWPGCTSAGRSVLSSSPPTLLLQQLD